MTRIILRVLMMQSGGRKMMIKDEIPLIMCLTHCWNNCNNAQSYLDIIDPEHKIISPAPWKEDLLSPDEFIKANSQEEDVQRVWS